MVIVLSWNGILTPFILNIMENTGFIEIHISGKKGQLQLTPDMYDISELRGLLDYAEQLLFPAIERKSRPIVSYEIKDGSVRHIFKQVYRLLSDSMPF